MNDFEKELELISQEAGDEPEVKLPSLEEQQEIVAELKKLEAEGKLTPEVLEQYFGKFNQKIQCQFTNKEGVLYSLF